jgi:hypothetical protein
MREVGSTAVAGVADSGAITSRNAKHECSVHSTGLLWQALARAIFFGMRWQV